MTAEDKAERDAIQWESKQPAPPATAIGPMGKTYGAAPVETVEQQRRSRWAAALRGGEK
jgi:hypothetical protein